MVKSKEAVLGEIHDLLCEHFRKVLNEGEQKVVDGELVRADPTAATLREVRQFLSDNNIDATAAAGSPLAKLKDAAVLPFPPRTGT